MIAGLAVVLVPAALAGSHEPPQPPSVFPAGVEQDGAMLAASPAAPLGAAADGTLSRSFGIPLEGVQAGRYELVVVAEDGATGARAEARAAFVVSGPSPPDVPDNLR